MKSFKEYLTESKKVYEFKVKIAGDCPKDCTEKIKLALSQYQLESCSGGKRTPIQERQVDFPEHANVNVTVFEVCTCYPATSLQIKNSIAETLKMSGALIKVRNAMEERELAINNANAAKSGKSVLEADYEKEDNQKLVGDKHTMSLLKELGKSKSVGEQKKGINDTILAKSVPIEKLKDKPAKQNNTSAVGSRKVKLPTAKGAL
jgi:hypothetical protein